MDESFRTVRLFVSSTFLDMAAERDRLAKFTFPALRRFCAQRGMVFTDVDLRWGITDEEKAEGRVLRICLAEIARCRPFFIGILGERYGWVPDAVSPDVLEREPWVAERPSRSITELEMLHGALTRPEIAERSRFYFRDPAYLETLSPADRARFVSVDPESRTKLTELKARIRASGIPVRENYRDPETFGQLVLEDLKRAIADAFPEDPAYDALAEDAAQHEAYATARRTVYVARPDDLERLAAQVEGTAPPLVVTGDAGVGKSALLANWTARFVSAHPGTVTVSHYVGASNDSTDWARMCHRIGSELQRCLGFTVEMPDEPRQLQAAFKQVLSMASVRGRPVLIIDGLDQLEDREAAHALPWLPDALPENVRLLLGTAPGPALDECRRRGWPSMQIEPLSAAERRALIEVYLRPRKLSTERLERIVSADQTASPLFLSVLLGELTLWGEHETLDIALSRYLSAPTVHELYERVLARWQADYDQSRPGLVRDATRYVWGVRRGLSESELLALLGGREPLARGLIAPLLLAAGGSLASRSGLMGFTHEYLRRAVEDLFLPGEADRCSTHAQLADFFDSGPHDTRRMDELPWQRLWARQWDRLEPLLADPAFVGRAYAHDAREVRRVWTLFEAQAGVRPADVYASVLDDPEVTVADLSAIADLLHKRGSIRESLALWTSLEARFRDAQSPEMLSACLLSESLCLHDLRRFDEALALLQEQMEVCSQLGDVDGWQRGLCNTAMTLQAMGRDGEAMSWWRRQEHILRGTGDDASLAVCLGNQALLLVRSGVIEDALEVFAEQERLSRRLGDADVLQACLGNTALALQGRGDYASSIAPLEEQESICRDTGYARGLIAALANLGTAMRETGRPEDARRIHREQEDLCRRTGTVQQLGSALGGQGLAAWAMGENREALSLLEAAGTVFEESGDLAGLRGTLGNQAVVRQALGDLTGAVDALQRQEGLCRRAGDLPGLARSLANRAVLMVEEPDTRHAALAVVEEAQSVARSTGLGVLATAVDAAAARVQRLVGH